MSVFVFSRRKLPPTSLDVSDDTSRYFQYLVEHVKRNPVQFPTSERNATEWAQWLQSSLGEEWESFAKECARFEWEKQEWERRRAEIEREKARAAEAARKEVTLKWFQTQREEMAKMRAQWEKEKRRLSPSPLPSPLPPITSRGDVKTSGSLSEWMLEYERMGNSTPKVASGRPSGSRPPNM